MISKNSIDLTNTPLKPSAAASAQKRVLLVEDDRSVRRYLEVTLRRAGYEVITAADGLEAMKLALGSSVDVVLTDAVMPHMSGQEFARFMRTTPKLSQIPIVLLTGQENRQAMAPAEELVDAFLTKPVKIEELKSCLVELLSRA